MSAPASNVVSQSVIEKKGGYTGSKPASIVPPPARTPSATIKPARAVGHCARMAASTAR